MGRSGGGSVAGLVSFVGGGLVGRSGGGSVAGLVRDGVAVGNLFGLVVRGVLRKIGLGVVVPVIVPGRRIEVRRLFFRGFVLLGRGRGGGRGLVVVAVTTFLLLLGSVLFRRRLLS